MLGDKLRELRKKHNKTQAEIGRLLGTDQSGYSKIENGIHSLPVSLLGTVANYYQITIDELLDFELEQPRSEIEKAYEKLDFHRINYIIDEDDFVKIPISKDYCFKVPTKKIPSLVSKLEEMCDDSLRETRTQVFKATLFDFLQAELNKTENNTDIK